MFWRLSSLSEKRSIALRSLALAAALLALPPTGLASADGPRINEFMAANDDIRDEDADTSDWLEIYNPTSEIADLRGWFLTDQSGDLAKWAFPDITIPPYECLFVWASGKNRTNQPSALHTNFRLSKQGGFVALVKPDGSTVASSMAYPVQYDNISYGVSPSDATV